uniref:Leucine-rich immune protein (Short) n=1 Tax=Anopheles dirus TaxID=7168 RepID=A0A9I3EH49_9DIPT
MERRVGGKMTYYLRVVLVLLVLLGAGAHGFSTYRCDEPDTPAIKATCLMRGVNLSGHAAIAEATFPDDVRHVALAMVDGSIPKFTRALALKLPKVQDLTVDGMRVEQFYIGPGLEQLFARNNSIRAVEFAAEPHRLRTLRLDHNQLTSVPSFGVWFNELKYLSLDGNRLERVALDAFAGLERLQSLSLARNELITVDPSAALGYGYVVSATPTNQQVLLARLKHLSLAANRLLTLNVTGWEMPSLVSLDLSNNDLYLLLDGTKQFTRFGALEELAYTGNDWNCGWLSEAQEALQATHVKTIDREPTGRCEREQMKSLRGVCCYDQLHERDSSSDPLEQRWELLSELRRRYELVQFAYELVQDADLNRITERAHELRGRLAGPVADDQSTIKGELVRLHGALANETAHLERLEESVERAALDLSQTIDELLERALRPKPTLDAVRQQTFGASLEGMERQIELLKRRIQTFVYEMDERERRLRSLDQLIEKREQQLTAVQKQMRALDERIEKIKPNVDEAYYLIDESFAGYPADDAYSRMKALPSGRFRFQRHRG